MSSSKDLMRGFILVSLLGAFLASCAAFLYVLIKNNGQLPEIGVMYLTGLLTMTGAAVGYWIHTSKGSTDKNPLLGPKPPTE